MIQINQVPQSRPVVQYDILHLVGCDVIPFSYHTHGT